MSNYEKVMDYLGPFEILPIFTNLDLEIDEWAAGLNDFIDSLPQSKKMLRDDLDSRFRGECNRRNAVNHYLKEIKDAAFCHRDTDFLKAVWEARRSREMKAALNAIADEIKAVTPTGDGMVEIRAKLSWDDTDGIARAILWDNTIYSTNPGQYNKEIEGWI